ncbi:hypothetical protein [Phenylobacterium soli]|uniref:Uncharacterized protein n=1 Tax=Phenylobacterium soli TaxID=2170551 RepID=A0A328AEZ6_9CAUL|nr:hypothetical protein [Phenylobacterium soli]RAK53302.1 hypothetical protein DJ017_01540 [Phenylobacterium soli]
MGDEEELRRRAETLLRQAASTANMNERGRLIDEAIRLRGAADDSAMPNLEDGLDLDIEGHA